VSYAIPKCIVYTIHIMDKKKYKISGYSTVLMYPWMMKKARATLADAKSTNENGLLYSMDIIVYSAFAIESFLNHIGEDVLNEEWDEKNPTVDKLKKIKSKLNISANQGEEPYQSVNMAIKFRNTIAHGKTKTISVSKEVWLTEQESKMYTIDSVWMEQSTIKNAEKIFTNIETVITELYQAHGLGKYPFLSLQSSSHTIELVEI